MSESVRHQSASSGSASAPVLAEDDSPKKLGLGLVAVAVVSSLIASTCCVIPLVLVLLGITGAWMVNLTSLNIATPVFIGIALVAMGWAGYLVFRPAAQCAYTVGADGAACAKNNRIMKRVYLASTAFIALLLLFPLVAPYFY